MKYIFFTQHKGSPNNKLYLNGIPVGADSISALSHESNDWADMDTNKPLSPL